MIFKPGDKVRNKISGSTGVYEAESAEFIVGVILTSRLAQPGHHFTWFKHSVELVKPRAKRWD